MDDESPEAAELFPELPAPGMRQFEITASIDGRDTPSMHAIVGEDEIEAVLGTALDSCLRPPELGFELKIRPLRANAAEVRPAVGG